MKSKIVLALILLLNTPWVQAASDVPWEWTMIIVGVISASIAAVLAIRNDKAEGVGLKILLAGLFFWILVFAQTIFLALIYHFFW